MQIQGNYHLIDREIGNSISQWKHCLDLFYDAAFCQELVGYRRSHTECSYRHLALQGAACRGDVVAFCNYCS